MAHWIVLSGRALNLDQVIMVRPACTCHDDHDWEVVTVEGGVHTLESKEGMGLWTYICVKGAYLEY